MRLPATPQASPVQRPCACERRNKQLCAPPRSSSSLRWLPPPRCVPNWPKLGQPARTTRAARDGALWTQRGAGVENVPCLWRSSLHLSPAKPPCPVVCTRPARAATCSVTAAWKGPAAGAAGCGGGSRVAPRPPGVLLPFPSLRPRTVHSPRPRTPGGCKAVVRAAGEGASPQPGTTCSAGKGDTRRAAQRPPSRDARLTRADRLYQFPDLHGRMLAISELAATGAWTQAGARGCKQPVGHHAVILLVPPQPPLPCLTRPPRPPCLHPTQPTCRPACPATPPS